MTSDTDSGSPSELNGTSIETPARAPTPVHQFGTRAVHAGAHVDATTGAVIAPVRQRQAGRETSFTPLYAEGYE